MRKNGVTIASRNFFINNSVGLSRCDRPIEMVKYIWGNIWCMLDWILSQNCWNILPLHTAHSGCWTTTRSEECKKHKTLFCPTNCLQPTPTPLLNRWKNIKIQICLWFCIIWTVFNTRTRWHFHYYLYCLGKTAR